MRFMERAPAILLTATGALLASVAAAPAGEQTVKWETIIGIIMPGNTVDGITGAGQPWSTLGGKARVDLASGRAEFEVRGLVLAGGNAIGTPGAITMVEGTLACNTTPPVAINTPLVPLSARGDAEFEGTIGPIPTTCTPANVAFLIRIQSTPTDRWIANGAVRTAPGM